MSWRSSTTHTHNLSIRYTNSAPPVAMQHAALISLHRSRSVLMWAWPRSPATLLSYPFNGALALLSCWAQHVKAVGSLWCRTPLQYQAILAIGKTAQCAPRSGARRFYHALIPHSSVVDSSAGYKQQRIQATNTPPPPTARSIRRQQRPRHGSRPAPGLPAGVRARHTLLGAWHPNSTGQNRCGGLLHGACVAAVCCPSMVGFRGATRPA